MPSQAPKYTPQEHTDVAQLGATYNEGWYYLHDKVILPQQRAHQVLTDLHNQIPISAKPLMALLS